MNLTVKTIAVGLKGLTVSSAQHGCFLEAPPSDPFTQDWDSCFTEHI